MVSEDGRASRRALLTGTGTALAGGALALAGCGSVATGKQAVKETSPAVRHQDIEILGRALELERRTVAAYIACIPLLTRPQRKAAREYLNEELEHTGELASLIKAAGGKARPRADSYALGHPTDGPGGARASCTRWRRCRSPATWSGSRSCRRRRCAPRSPRSSPWTPSICPWFASCRARSPSPGRS